MERATCKFVRNMLFTRDKANMSPVPSYISLTTITSTFKLSKELDIEQVREFLNTGVRTKKLGAETHKGFQWVVKENRFYNQVSVVFIDSYSRKSVKFFPNGRIHVTGCSDLIDCARVRAQVEVIMSSMFNEPVTTGEFQIHMINTNFSINSILNLSSVIAVCERNGCDVSFKPENYSAVKVKFTPVGSIKKVTASIFGSGCILVTGATCLSDISKSYEFLLRILADCRVGPSKVQKTFDVFMGYSFDTDWRKLLEIQ